MNLKKFFYQDYYRISAEVEVRQNGRDVREQRTFDLKKSGNSEDWKKIKEYNEPLLKVANAGLTGYKLKPEAAGYLDFKSMSGRELQCLTLTTTYPGLFTGSGYNHETGNTGELSLGFFFDHTTGLPILPGSSIKGVLRGVFPRFKGDATDPLKPVVPASQIQQNKAAFVAALFSIPKKNGQTDFEKVHQLELALFEGVDFQGTAKARAEAKLKNLKDAGTIVCRLPMSKHDVFLDAFISKGGKDGHILGLDAITPHGDNPLKNPIPLPFLKVLPGVEFTFQFLLRTSELADGTKISPELKKNVFKVILTTFGAGAKTNVGYGQFADQEYAGGPGLENRDVAVKQAKVFDKKPKMGDPLEAKVIEPGKVEINTPKETWIAKMTGNCPPVGTIVNARINGIDKSGKIIQVSYQGNVR